MFLITANPHSVVLLTLQNDCLDSVLDMSVTHICMQCSLGIRVTKGCVKLDGILGL